MDIPKEGVIVHLKDLGQTSKDRDADAVGTAFDLRVDAPGDVQIHKLQFGNHLVLRQFPGQAEASFFVFPGICRNRSREFAMYSLQFP